LISAHFSRFLNQILCVKKHKTLFKAASAAAGDKKSSFGTRFPIVLPVRNIFIIKNEKKKKKKKVEFCRLRKKKTRKPQKKHKKILRP
jgi:hypothetical protein